MEDEARQNAEDKAEEQARERGEDDDATAQRITQARDAAVPKPKPRPKAQRNFTDPESRS
ncbi:MAG: hypothetical protein ACRD0P_28315 [Stackebrandtia sp.]